MLPVFRFIDVILPEDEILPVKMFALEILAAAIILPVEILATDILPADILPADIFPVYVEKYAAAITLL